MSLTRACIHFEDCRYLSYSHQVLRDLFIVGVQKVVCPLFGLKSYVDGISKLNTEIPSFWNLDHGNTLI